LAVDGVGDIAARWEGRAADGELAVAEVCDAAVERRYLVVSGGLEHQARRAKVGREGEDALTRGCDQLIGIEVPCQRTRGYSQADHEEPVLARDPVEGGVEGEEGPGIGTIEQDLAVFPD